MKCLPCLRITTKLRLFHLFPSTSPPADPASNAIQFMNCQHGFLAMNCSVALACMLLLLLLRFDTFPKIPISGDTDGHHFQHIAVGAIDNVPYGNVFGSEQRTNQHQFFIGISQLFTNRCFRFVSTKCRLVPVPLSRRKKKCQELGRSRMNGKMSYLE